eukprot:comp19864_c0_seq1/m.23995 comp19864_c0_seq1/g.23995  ORF comp19864_c0_seq1/g.23995 comp19864_c0_seq1/m.23995 type:complete len:706 (-) comp19864_c0_seq1:1044-3161(-)
MTGCSHSSDGFVSRQLFRSTSSNDLGPGGPRLAVALGSKSEEVLLTAAEIHFWRTSEKWGAKGSQKSMNRRFSDPDTLTPLEDVQITPMSQRPPKRHSIDAGILTDSVSQYSEDTLEAQEEAIRQQLATLCPTIQNTKNVQSSGLHIFQYSDAHKFCHVCRKRIAFRLSTGCTVCKYAVHAKCLPNSNIPCRRTCSLYFGTPTDAEMKKTSSTPMEHHWVEGNFKHEKCCICNKACGATLTKLRSPAEMRCSWCKRVVHASCHHCLEGPCDMGPLRMLTLSPNDIHINQYMPDPSLSLHSPSVTTIHTTHTSPQASTSTQGGNSARGTDNDTCVLNTPGSSLSDVSASRSLKAEHIQVTVPNHCAPLVVFVNPKSGGNQGRDVLQQMQYLLNPWQVFDLSQGGPEFGLQVFRNASRLRILVAGGDGTVGWVLSAMDKFKIEPTPPVAILPLGTGNDLARVLRWGGGFTTGQSVLQSLVGVQEAQITCLDRWSVASQPIETGEELPEGTSMTLPLDVVNNYFSFGADAGTVLAFHLARNRDPKKFNSRLGNKLYYGLQGGKQMIAKNVSKELYKHVSLVCDGRDYDAELSEKRLQGIVFLNIPSYAGGTNPWGVKRSEENLQSLDDGQIEVLGVTSVYQLAKQQVGIGQCVRLCQCKEAQIITRKPFPMQIDGEPCLLAPSVISLSFHNRVRVLLRREGRRGSVSA